MDEYCRSGGFRRGGGRGGGSTGTILVSDGFSGGSVGRKM